MSRGIREAALGNPTPAPITPKYDPFGLSDRDYEREEYDPYPSYGSVHKAFPVYSEASEKGYTEEMKAGDISIKIAIDVKDTGEAGDFDSENYNTEKMITEAESIALHRIKMLMGANHSKYTFVTTPIECLDVVEVTIRLTKK